MDLAGLSQDTVSIKGISFIGSYTSEELESKEGWYVDIIDTTPDCSLSPSGETEKGTFLIGALRAFLQVSWDDPYNQGGSRSITEKREIVLKDNPNNIFASSLGKTGEGAVLYDLSGRRVDNGQRTGDKGQILRGIYIQNGKKVAVK